MVQNRALTSLLIQRIYNDILIDMSMLKTGFIDGANRALTSLLIQRI